MLTGDLSRLYEVGCKVCMVYSALCEVGCKVCMVYSALCEVGCKVCMVYSALCEVGCKVCTGRSVLIWKKTEHETRMIDGPMCDSFHTAAVMMVSYLSAWLYSSFRTRFCCGEQ